ncbi:zinc ribbon domain-containing protein [Eubacterium sp. am_0171]|uniref:zinc-ribbon domain-containing protein n=1 Tax=unclassified Eubacterium (in: firmicutes) TaxID=2624479 RepID=UPI00101F7655|nr:MULTISPECIES: zinc-ribbon domain-containing protein [unclassified Eubacterium (in: firmicutes)]MSC86178.1 zinc-ribbon domain-containing protein [Eubacterium sp. BIOML-A1]MSD08503.1 zinc-ribbon domain-containing protein [Eubacterium sp. BIOML-A2]RYT12123.1 zinc ribbon domain-containing protein [Eubacterium sp. am_0171]
MSKYCMSCGNKLRAGNKFCDKCGQAVPADDIEINNARKKGYKTKEIGVFVILVIVAVIFMGVAGVRVFDNKGYEKPFGYLETAVNKCDADAFIRAFHPELLSEDYIPTDDDMVDEFGRYGAKINFDIISAEKLSEEDLQTYSDLLGELKEGYRVKVDFSYEGQTDIYSQWSREESYSEVKEVDVVKYDGKWCFPSEDVLW